LIEVDQGGLDLVVAIRTPDGLSESYNSPLLRDESELVLLDTDMGGKFTITLLSSEYTGAVAKITIQASEITRSSNAGRERLAALRLISLGSMANHQGNLEGWNSALEAYEQANVHLRKAGESRYLARSLFSIATIEYWQMLNWDHASELAAEAAKIYTDSGQERLAANAIHLQAASIIEKANEVEKSVSGGLAPESTVLFDEALKLFNRALDTQKRLENPRETAQITNNIGLTYYYMGDWDAAAPYFHDAAGQFQSLREWGLELLSLTNVAVIDFEKGHLIKAIDSFKRILEISPPDKREQYRADALDNLGASLLAIGRFDEALQSFSQALAIHEQINDLKGQGRSLAGVGITYFSIGEQELALEFLETALIARQKANDGRGQVSVLNFIGNLHRQNGDYSRALKAHSEAQRLVTAPIDKARGQVYLARDLAGAGKADEALEILETAKGIARDSNNQKLLADIVRNLPNTGARRRTIASHFWHGKSNPRTGPDGLGTGTGRTGHFIG